MISEYLNKMRVNDATKVLEKRGYTVLKMEYAHQDPRSVHYRSEKTEKALTALVENSSKKLEGAL